GSHLSDVCWGAPCWPKSSVPIAGANSSLLGSASLPMAILQASSTQNDLVASLWLVCFVYFLVRLVTAWKWTDAALGGISLGLAMLTKVTSYLLAPPFLA